MPIDASNWSDFPKAVASEARPASERRRFFKSEMFFGESFDFSPAETSPNGEYNRA